MLPAEHDWVALAGTPDQAKRRGRAVKARRDWDSVRVSIMRRVLAAKFAPGTALAQLLDSTGDAVLTEGNSHGDKFWGVCGGQGRNMLGQLLMQVRADNRKIAA